MQMALWQGFVWHASRMCMAQDLLYSFSLFAMAHSGWSCMQHCHSACCRLVLGRPEKETCNKRHLGIGLEGTAAVISHT